MQRGHVFEASLGGLREQEYISLNNTKVVVHKRYSDCFPGFYTWRSCSALDVSLTIAPDLRDTIERSIGRLV